MKIVRLIIPMLMTLLVFVVHSQQPPDSLLAMSGKLTKQYLDAVSTKSDKINAQLDKQTEKYLSKLEKQEQKLQKKLAKIDSMAAKNVFSDATKRYEEIKSKVKSKSENLLHKSGQYLPWLDSAGTSLKFLDNNPVLANLNGGSAKLNDAIGKVKALENEFKQAANVKDFIKQRKEYLREQLRNYNLGNDLKKYNQTAYYYSQQVNEYRQVLNDPDKAERKVLELLNKLPAFKEFISKNSFLSSAFGNLSSGASTAGGGNPGQLIGLQTRSSLEEMIRNQLGGNGFNIQAVLQQNSQQAQSLMDIFKNKISELGGNNTGADLEMPEYKVNEQKTKTFLNRLEYGANLQSVKSNYYFPATTDLALMVGYKVNDRSIVGLGMGYKVGWGKDINHINFSSEGVSFRSFLDIKLKKSFFASGGFEYNYQQSFYSLNELYNLNSWQQSGLLGISKIISLKTKIFKKTKMQFLWDFLSYQQRPVTQPLKFRIGYNF